ncbi:DUF3969 family protein [Pseudomonas mendocina]|uniref:DUF3969 family protein n=1 Tax=Ectopseudomonas mendocina TaxID=300 RepID=UPI0023D9B80F|nr:DUF3969 family protein [Pseudomonas mendocina]MDF2077299.1 DUF3969 family protein [Pseudomonas mendocina]
MSRVILEFKVGEESQASRFIALHCIGLLVSFRDNYIPFGDVEGFFLPRMVRNLQEQGLDSRLVELVCLGCELEDVNSLVPDKLKRNVDLILEGFLEYLLKSSSFDSADVNITSKI